jgi:hypothetical protein
MMYNNWSNPTAVIIGSFNPWNDSHKAVVDEIFKKGEEGKYKTSEAQQLLIMIKHNEKADFFTTITDIHAALTPQYKGKFEVIRVPNITNLFYGRSIGYEVERINLPEELESLNTKITKSEQQQINKRFWQNRG